MIGPGFLARAIVRASLPLFSIGALLATAQADAQATETAPAAPATPQSRAQARAQSRADCERIFRPEVGQAGKDVIWVPTPTEMVTKILQMAKVTAQDQVVDLGAGDGKIAIAAATEFGATAVGIEYNPDMVRLAQCMVQVEGANAKVRVIQGDIFKEDFSQATVVTMYLLPELNLCIRHRLLAMKPGTRVASHQFTMGDWDADESFDFEYRTALLWIVPARVGGSWQLRGPGDDKFTLALHQTFQKVTGSIASGSARQPLVGATLRGDSLRFAFNDRKGVTRTFIGTVKDAEIKGVLRGAGSQTTVAGSRTGEAEPALWATMAPRCQRFYQ